MADDKFWVDVAFSTYLARKAHVEVPAVALDKDGYMVPLGFEQAKCCLGVPRERIWYHLHSVVHCALMYNVDPYLVLQEVAHGREKFFPEGRTLRAEELQVQSLRLRVRDHLPRNIAGWQVSSSPRTGEVSDPGIAPASEV